MKVTTSKGNIRVNNVQVGWSVEKNDQGEWDLLNFDDEVVFTAKTKKAALSHYCEWYAENQL
jgi:hypothetical protein|tara:strand:+ start:20042 stop:20227 length:186 start_codon:yes stop_codon:yes gene_type:complete